MRGFAQRFGGPMLQPHHAVMTFRSPRIDNIDEQINTFMEKMLVKISSLSIAVSNGGSIIATVVFEEEPA